jgi:serine/threonine-protein kinase
VTLGGLFVHPAGDLRTRLVSQRRRLAVLALLAAAAERGLSREKLLGYLWPDTEEEKARRVLSQAVYGLRQDLAAEAVLGTNDLRLNPEVIASDLAEFRSAVGSERLEAAAAAYGGPFADAFYLPGAPEFDRWVEEERGVLARQYGEVLDRLARAADARPDRRAAVTWWRRLAAHDPLSSAGALGLMQASAAAGDREGALQHARVHEALVREELGVPPSREVASLARALAEQTIAAGPAPAAPPPPEVASGPPPAEPLELEPALAAALAPDFRLGSELSPGPVHTFVAEDVELGRKVLVKALSRHLAFGLSPPRFERGIRLAAQLQHPHILPVLTAGRAGEWPYYVTPYLDGETLAARLSREGAPLPMADAVRLLRHIGSALAYAHRRGIIHRDINPEHVLLSGDYALISDFGVAKAMLDSARGETAIMSVGMAIGTPGYMAPEQALGDPATDHRADLYALGALARAMLPAEPPPPLAALVARCLAPRPAERPQSADEFLQALDAAETAPVAAVASATRPRWPMLLTAGAALLAVGAALLLLG